MKTKDMVENYLLSLGLNIKDTYKFIPKRDYDFNKEIISEKVQIGKYTVELSKINRNSKELRHIIWNAKNNFMTDVKVSGNVGEACKNLVNNSIIYYTDFLKYITNNLEVSAELTEKVIILCNGAIDNLGKEIQNALADYNIKLAEAQREGQAAAAETMAHARSEINKTTGTYVQLHEQEGLFGNSVYGTVVNTGYSQSRKDAMMAGARQAAATIESVHINVANDMAVEGINKLRSKLLDNFNKTLVNLLCAKLDGVFNEYLLENDGNDLNDSPLFYSHFYSIVDELEEKDFQNYKKALDFFQFDITKDLKKHVEDNIYNYYVKEGKCDYDKVDYKLYVYLTGQEFGLGSEVATRIKNYLSNVNFGTTKENKKLIATFEKKKELVNECKYLTNDEKETILKSYDTFKRKNAKAVSNTIIDIVLSIILVVSGLYAIITGWKYTNLFGVYDGNIYLYGYGGIIASLVLGYFVLKMNKNIFKKILQVIFSIAFITVPIFLSKPISTEEAKREGKYMIKLEVLDETEIIFLKKGELIPLEKIEMNGYAFNGWVEGGFYVDEPVCVDGKGKFVADIYDTNQKLSTITFKFDNGKGNMVVKVPINSEIPLPSPPTKEGYRFLGWYDEKLYKLNYGKLKARLEETTFRAEWEKE